MNAVVFAKLNGGISVFVGCMYAGERVAFMKQSQAGMQFSFQSCPKRCVAHIIVKPYYIHFGVK